MIGPTEAFSRIRARLAGGDGEGAKGLLTEVDETPHVREVSIYVDVLPAMVRTAVSTGHLALAERLASGVEPRYPLEEQGLLAARAVLAEARYKSEEAAGLYAEAADHWKSFGVVLEQAFALLGRGRCLVALGQAAEAAEPLREAWEIFAGLGAKPALAETDVLLEQATALTS